jgi:hypothetical protein
MKLIAPALILAVAKESPEVAKAWLMTVKSSTARIKTCRGLQQLGLKVPTELASALQREGYLLEPPRNTVLTAAE